VTDVYTHILQLHEYNEKYKRFLSSKPDVGLDLSIYRSITVLVIGVLPSLTIIENGTRFFQRRDIGTGAHVLHYMERIRLELEEELGRLQASANDIDEYSDDAVSQRLAVDIGVDFIDLVLLSMRTRFEPLTSNANNYVVAALLHPARRAEAKTLVDDSVIKEAIDRLSDTAVEIGQTANVDQVKNLCDILWVRFTIGSHSTC